MDSILADFDITTIHRMSPNQQRQWIKYLDITREAYTLELRQRGHNQNVITRYMVSTSEMVHGTLESDCKNETDTIENEVVRNSLESDARHNRTGPEAHCPTSRATNQIVG